MCTTIFYHILLTLRDNCVRRLKWFTLYILVNYTILHLIEYRAFNIDTDNLCFYNNAIKIKLQLSNIMNCISFQVIQKTQVV